MKAEELMIGDIVKVNKDGVCIKKDTIIEVRCVDADNVLEKLGLIGCATCVSIKDHCDQGGIWCDYLIPIPLTAEILDKNGFKFNPFSIGFYEYKSEYGNVSCGFDTDYWQFYVNNCIIPNHFHYVHELQHALRLCGLDDLADNFKMTKGN